MVREASITISSVNRVNWPGVIQKSQNGQLFWLLFLVERAKDEGMLLCLGKELKTENQFLNFK